MESSKLSKNELIDLIFYGIKENNKILIQNK